MDRQQVYALLGQWHDIVGRDGRGGHGGRGGGRGDHRGHRGGRGGGWGGWGGYGYPGYPGYGYDLGYGGYGGYGGYDPSAYLAYIQQLQQQLQMLQMQQQQVPVPVPVPVPTAPTESAPTPPPGGPAPTPPAKTAGWYDLTGPYIGALPPGDFPLMARAAVVDAPLPTQANRDILPMSTGVPILPTQSAQITGRPQTLVFKIGRFVISNAGTAGGAADWIVNDIKIGNRSQFVQSGDVPGDLFATNAIDTFVRFEAAQTAMDVVVVVTYIGLNESGCPFFGAMVGTAAV